METIQLHKKGSKVNVLLMDYQPESLVQCTPSFSPIYSEKITTTTLMVLLNKLQSLNIIQLVSDYRTYRKEEICLKSNVYACAVKIINDLGFCLEEYIDFIKGYLPDNLYVYAVDKQCVKMFYLPMIEDTLSLSLRCNREYQIPENNVDGVIVTIWRSLYGS